MAKVNFTVLIKNEMKSLSGVNGFRLELCAVLVRVYYNKGKSIKKEE